MIDIYKFLTKLINQYSDKVVSWYVAEPLDAEPFDVESRSKFVIRDLPKLIGQTFILILLPLALIIMLIRKLKKRNANSPKENSKRTMDKPSKSAD